MKFKKPYIPGCRYVGELEWDSEGMPQLSIRQICIEVYTYSEFGGVVTAWDGEEDDMNDLESQPNVSYYVFEYDNEKENTDEI